MIISVYAILVSPCHLLVHATPVGHGVIVVLVVAEYVSQWIWVLTIIFSSPDIVLVTCYIHYMTDFIKTQNIIMGKQLNGHSGVAVAHVSQQIWVLTVLSILRPIL